MTDLIADLERGLSIDKNALDVEVQQHPDVFYRVARELEYAVSEHDAAKQSVEDIKAEVDAEIRRSAADQSEKITETQVESRKRLNPDVAKALDVLHAKAYKMGQLKALKESFVQRSYALSQLTDLYNGGYFSLSAGQQPKSLRGSIADNAKEEMNRMRRRDERYPTR